VQGDFDDFLAGVGVRRFETANDGFVNNFARAIEESSKTKAARLRERLIEKRRYDVGGPGSG